MKNKKLHINKGPHGDYPKPDVPATEAWKQMHGMLLEYGFTEKPQNKKRRRFLFFLLIAGLMGAGFGVWHFTNDISQPGKQGTATVVQDSGDRATTGGSTALNNDKKDTGTPYSTNEDKLPDHVNNQHRPVIETSGRAGRQPAIKESPDDTPESRTTTNPDDAKTAKQDRSDADKESKITGINNEQPVTGEPEGNISGDSLSADPQAKTNTNIDSANNDDQVLTRTKQAPAGKSTKKKTAGRFHFGLQWDMSFSLANNSNYFKGYNGNDQYYMWLIPSAWGKFDITKRHGITIHADPYAQQFGGEKILSVEKPLIASVAPDIVTNLIKTRGYSFGLQYEYRLNEKISMAAGLDYFLLQKALYKEQLTDTSTGIITAERIYAANRNEYDFRYMRSSALNGNIGVKYHFNKLSVGAGVTRPFTNLSANDQFKVRPVNGSIYLQYRFR